MMKIKPTHSGDIPGLQKVLDRTGLFPSDMLLEMVSGFLSADTPEDRWLTCSVDGEAIGFCYARPEAMTDGTWNMLAIAVLPEFQGRGAGSMIVRALETALAKGSHRLLIVDTSGTEEFHQTRAFYRKNGYTEEACIRDFWAEGDDKVIFRKSLS